MKAARAILVGIFIAVCAAHAALIVTLGPSSQNAAPGTEIAFNGTLTNTSTTEKFFLNDIQVALSGASASYLALKSNSFYANVPGILLPGETYQGPLFRIAVTVAAPPADYAGGITLRGGADIFAAASLAGANFVLTLLDASSRHSADINNNSMFSLVELTRVIELYNTRNGTTRTGCYRLEATGEDGFAPEPTRANSAVATLARYHSGDSNRDGKVGLFELTRVIELYNFRSGTTRTGQYRVQAGTEDGFAPGP